MRSKLKTAWMAVFLIQASAGFLSAQGYETLYALTDQKSGLLSESGFRSVMGSLQSTFKSFSSYLFDGGRRNAGDSVFSWDSYDNPSPYDVYGVVALYEKISVRWGNEIIHWKWPNMLRESDPAYAGYLRDLQEPYHKLGAHAKALAGAYQNAVKGLEKDRLEEKPTKDLEGYIDSGYLFDYRDRVRVLRERGEREMLRKKLSDSRERFLVAWSIAELKAEEFTQDIAALLSVKDPYLRMEVLFFLGSLGKSEYTDKAAGLLSDFSPKVRRMAVWYLGQVKAVKYKARLEAFLKDQDKDVREMARNVLDQMK